LKIVGHFDNEVDLKLCIEEKWDEHGGLLQIFEIVGGKLVESII